MARLTLFVLLFIVSLGFCAAAVDNRVRDEVVAPYVCVGPLDDPWGAGTCIRLNGEDYILTAYHVIHQKKLAGGWDPIFVTQKVGKVEHKWDCTVERVSLLVSDGGLDLALLKPADTKTRRLAHAAQGLTETLELGETAWIIGTGGSDYATLDKTIVSSLDYSRLGFDRVSTRLAGSGGWYGNSGGGLYVLRDNQWRLVGVVTHLTAHRPAATLLAVTPKDLRSFLAPRMEKADE